jgi:hypothetical protein
MATPLRVTTRPFRDFTSGGTFSVRVPSFGLRARARSPAAAARSVWFARPAADSTKLNCTHADASCPAAS